VALNIEAEAVISDLQSKAKCKLCHKQVDDIHLNYRNLHKSEATSLLPGSPVNLHAALFVSDCCDSRNFCSNSLTLSYEYNNII